MSSSEQDAGAGSASHVATDDGGPATPGTPPIDRDSRFRAIGQAVERLIQERGPQPGSVISTWLRQSYDFDPKVAGFANLSSFLSAYALLLERISRAGADVIWGFHEQAQEVGDNESLPHQLWRAIASPNSGRTIVVFVHTRTAEWRAEKVQSAGLGSFSEPAEVEQQGEWKRIPPLSPEGHRRIAEEFLKRPDVEVVKRTLEAALEQKVWWMPWMQTLGRHPNLVQAWYAAREGALRQHIRNSLAAAGIPETLLDEATAFPSPGPPRAPTNSDRQRGGDHPPLRERSIRELVLAVVAHMDDGQLRDLRLPAGAVLDALRG